MVQDAPEYSEVIGHILEFINEDLLVAHNASFDMGVLLASSKAINRQLPKLRYGCSLKIARKTYNLEGYRLNAVAYAIGHEEFQHHNALADSDACARIVIHAAGRHGAEDLPELLEITKVRLGEL
jgi:DNA polymerase-3 subunit epsilon